MLDKLDRVVCVGDVISMPSYDHGTTLRVMAIDGDVMIVKKHYRGKKSFPIRFPNSSRYCRCDFMIVNR